MRKITLFLAVVGMMTLGSCSSNDDVDKDTIGEVFQYTNVNFLPNDYSVVLEFPHQLYYSTDMVLVYRLTGYFQGDPIWKLLPETYYFDDGTLDYRYDNDYTSFDAEVHLEGYDLANLTNDVKLNQTLRVLVVPAGLGKTAKADFKNYKAVVKAYNIDESKMVKVTQ